MTKDDIKNAMTDLGFSEDEMCDAMGINIGTLRKWIYGTRKPNNAAIRLIKFILCLHSNYPEILLSCIDDCSR